MWRWEYSGFDCVLKLFCINVLNQTIETLMQKCFSTQSNLEYYILMLFHWWSLLKHAAFNINIVIVIYYIINFISLPNNMSVLHFNIFRMKTGAKFCCCSFLSTLYHLLVKTFNIDIVIVIYYIINFISLPNNMSVLCFNIFRMKRGEKFCCCSFLSTLYLLVLFYCGQFVFFLFLLL